MEIGNPNNLCYLKRDYEYEGNLLQNSLEILKRYVTLEFDTDIMKFIDNRYISKIRVIYYLLQTKTRLYLFYAQPNDNMNMLKHVCCTDEYSIFIV